MSGNQLTFCLFDIDITSLVQWWSQTDIELYLDDPKVLEYITGNENAIAIMNHKYDVGKLRIKNNKQKRL
jgi:hypothetical protein